MYAQASNKRGWLYGGLAVAPGVAMARKVTHQERVPRAIGAAPQSVVLVGDKLASGVEPTLRKVLTDHGRQLSRVPLHTFASTPSSGRVVVLADVPLDVVLAAAPEAARTGSRLVIVPPLAPWNLSRAAADQLRRSRASVVPVSRLRLATTPDGKVPTAAGFATLAGAIWTYLR